MTHVPQPDQAPLAPTSPRSGSTLGKLGLGLVVVAVVAVLGYMALASDGLRNLRNGAPQDSQAVATVNDTTITRHELDEQIDQLVAAGQLPSREEMGDERGAIEHSVVEQMVAQMLLLEDAQRQGITVAEADVAARYDMIAAQFTGEGESFDQLLATQGLTADTFRESLHDQLLLEAYVSRLGDTYNLAVSDEEVRQVYDTQAGSDETAPSFEEVEPQIRQQLAQQKLAEVLPTVIAELTEAAQVEILL